MKPPISMLSIALLLVFGVPTYSAGQENGQQASEDAAPKPNAQITKWISQLDNDEFKDRDQASQALINAGAKALQAVLKATHSKQAEVRSRAWGILFAMSISNDKPTSNAVRVAAKEMLQSQDRDRVTQARKILEYPKTRARQILLKLGVRFDRPDSVSIPSGSPITAEHMVQLKVLTIRSVDLRGNQEVTDISPLSALTQLETLYISGTKVRDLSAVRHFKQLKHLSLDKTPVADLSPLKSLRHLKQLSFTETGVVDVSALSGLTNLETLVFRNCNVKDIAALANLRSLKLLRIRNTSVADVSALANLTNLEDLDLSDTKVKDLSALAKLTNLKQLRLYGVAASNYGFLRNLKKLEWFFLSGAGISDLSSLASLPNLVHLKLDGTKVTNPSPLATLPKIRSVNLQNTEVSAADVAQLKRALPKCNIRH